MTTSPNDTSGNSAEPKDSPGSASRPMPRKKSSPGWMATRLRRVRPALRELQKNLTIVTEILEDNDWLKPFLRGLATVFVALLVSRVAMETAQVLPNSSLPVAELASGINRWETYVAVAICLTRLIRRRRG